MTLNELKEEIISLGFNEIPGTDTSLAHHANRALTRIFSDRGVRARARLYVRSARPEIIISDIARPRDKELTFPVGAGSLYLSLSGEGSFRIEDEGGVRFYDFCSEDAVFKDLLGNDARIIFSGKHDYVIATLAVYREHFGSSTDLIPEPSGKRRILLKERIPDFDSLDGIPTDGNGQSVFCLCCSDDELLLSEDFSGQLCVSYKRLPHLISPSAPNARIDIGNDLRPLLPLLTAAYILIECDSELSEFYEREYVERMKLIGRTRSHADNRYYDVTGW